MHVCCIYKPKKKGVRHSPTFPYIKPKCQHFWENRFPNNDFIWELIWSKIPHCTKEARIISLNWKILHNIYPTKTMLYRMGKEESNICNQCNVIDNVDHFFLLM